MLDYQGGRLTAIERKLLRLVFIAFGRSEAEKIVARGVYVSSTRSQSEDSKRP